MKIFKFAIEGRLLRKLFDELIELIDTVIQYIVFLFYSLFTKTDDHKIMFFTSRGTYDCNPSFIADEMLKDKRFRLVWAYRDIDFSSSSQYPEDLTLVQYGSVDYYREAASSKIWIDNAMNVAYTIPYKKKDQIMMQTWHGSIGLKRFDTNSDKKWIRKVKKSVRWTDYIISNSFFETQLYRNTFWKNNCMNICI